ncbi:hypothetical protein [Stigmatella erecta]|nr:hypothetical protein [Stigmatella erecta]
MGSNAFLLSIIYLLAGIGVELARRFYPTRLVQQLSLSLDSLPARALDLVGALEPLRATYLDGRISDAQVRLVFGLTTIAVIFILAFGVGLLVGGLRSYVERRALRKTRQRGPG